MHCASGKWYIGSTGRGMDCRRYHHYAEAHDPTRKSKPKFHRALLDTEEDDWIWGVHQEFQDISRADLLRIEGDYQRAFDSVANGFNSYQEDNTKKPVAERKKENHVVWVDQHLKRVGKEGKKPPTEKRRAYHRQYYQANRHKWTAAAKDPVQKAKKAEYMRMYYRQCKAGATSGEAAGSSSV